LKLVDEIRSAHHPNKSRYGNNNGLSGISSGRGRNNFVSRDYRQRYQNQNQNRNNQNGFNSNPVFNGIGQVPQAGTTYYNINAPSYGPPGGYHPHMGGAPQHGYYQPPSMHQGGGHYQPPIQQHNGTHHHRDQDSWNNNQNGNNNRATTDWFDQE
jgi:hypothetical protein